MIDLDGVLDNYEKYTEDIPKIRKGAKDFIVKLSKDYELILFTTRSPMLATKWLINICSLLYKRNVITTTIASFNALNGIPTRKKNVQPNDVTLGLAALHILRMTCFGHPIIKM